MRRDGICYKCGKCRSLISDGRCDDCYYLDLINVNNKIAVDKKLIEEVLDFILKIENCKLPTETGFTSNRIHSLSAYVGIRCKLEEILKW